MDPCYWILPLRHLNTPKYNYWLGKYCYPRVYQGHTNRWLHLLGPEFRLSVAKDEIHNDEGPDSASWH